MPCPVRAKPDRCKLAPGGDRVMCFRTPSADPARGNQAWFHPHPDAPSRGWPRPGPTPTFHAATDFGKVASEYAERLTPGRAQALAATLMLPADAFDALPLIGLNSDTGGEHWTFPEADANGNVLGVTRRYRDGGKKQLAGGKRGLTVPIAFADRPGPLYVCEGTSDTLALTRAGLAAVGRPSNAAGRRCSPTCSSRCGTVAR